MSEVTYEYVKGSGWVPSSGVVVKLACGTMVRVERREPEPGESFWLVGKKSSIQRDYGLDLEGVGKALIDYGYTLRAFFSGDFVADPLYECFTLVPL